MTGTSFRWTANAWPRPWAWSMTRASPGCQNSLDAMSDRDFAIEFTAAASLFMVHISHLSEELVL